MGTLKCNLFKNLKQKWGALELPGRVDSESNLGLDLWSMFHWEINVSKLFISSVYAANILILSHMVLPVVHIKLTEKFVKTHYKWKHKKIPHIFLSFWKDKPINMKIWRYYLLPLWFLIVLNNTTYTRCPTKNGALALL